MRRMRLKRLVFGRGTKAVAKISYVSPCSSVDRALASGARSRRFESFQGHFLRAYLLQRVGFIYAQKSKIALRAFGRLLCSRALEPSSPQPLMVLFIGLSLVLDGSQAIFVKPLTISPLSHTMK